MRKTYLGTNKEMFDAELYAIVKTLEMALKNEVRLADGRLIYPEQRYSPGQTFRQPSNGCSTVALAQGSGWQDISLAGLSS